MSLRVDGGALRLRLMEQSHEMRGEAKDEAHDLRGRAVGLKLSQIQLETEAERESVRTSGWKSVASIGSDCLRWVGFYLSTVTWGISAAVAEIAAQGVTYGAQKGFEKRDLAAAKARHDGGVLGVQASTMEAHADRLDEMASGERRFAHALESAQERIQRDLRKAQST